MTAPSDMAAPDRRAAPSGLIYYPDDRPGITRRRAGRGWSYRAPDGTTIDDADERGRINALAVPPAYERVWISPERRGHLQATGYDDRARKQYRYHADWAAWRARTKFAQLPAFGAALPRLRRRVNDVLADGDAGERDFAVAAVLRLIDRVSIRVGDEGYRRENGTEGATTLRRRNMTMDGRGLRLDWRAKGGTRVRRQIGDRRLAQALERLADLPGAPLFEYRTGEAVHALRADGVNDWLREATGLGDVSAKTYRTWNGSVAALKAAMAADGSVTIKAMTEAAAERLHNTPTVARNAYVHPEVIALAEGGPMPDVPDGPRGLRVAERALLGMIAEQGRTC